MIAHSSTVRVALRGRPGPGSLWVEQMQREHFACQGCSQGLRLAAGRAYK